MAVTSRPLTVALLRAGDSRTPSRLSSASPVMLVSSLVTAVGDKRDCVDVFIVPGSEYINAVTKY